MRKLLNSLGLCFGVHAKCALLFCVAVIYSAAGPSQAAELLIADRLGNGVFRYSDTGQLLGVVTREVIVLGVPPTYLYQPTGIAISPDYAKFYVSS